MAKWFPLTADSTARGREFANSSLPLPCLGPTLGTTQPLSATKLVVHRLNAYIRGGYLDAPDVTLNDFLVIAPGF